MIYSVNLFNKIKRYRIITFIALVFLCGFLVYFLLFPDFYYLYWGPIENTSCHYIETDDTLPRADNALFTPPSRSVFFHETSCKGDLDSRQACAVESAARASPDWQINVLFAAPVAPFALNTGRLTVLLNYSNVNLFRVHVVKFAKGTPLENMIAGGALNRTIFRISHTSDMLRYLSLYKFGGIYLDLDVVVAKPLSTLVRNWAAKESDVDVAAGALAFSRDELGRSMAEAAVRDIQNNYRGDAWDNNGPGVITRILEQQCFTKKPALMSAVTCNGFEVYGPQYFYPVPYWKAGVYFEPGEVQGENTAYVQHVWNMITSEFPVHKDSPYAKLARKHCPEIYKLYGGDFGG